MIFSAILPPYGCIKTSSFFYFCFIFYQTLCPTFQAIYSMLGNALTNQDTDSPEERTQKIFAKMDVNNDGVLTRSEFVDGCMKDQFLYQMLTADAGGCNQE